MDSPATPSVPRLRLSRNTHAYERPFSSERDHFPEPAGTFVDALTEDSDRDDDQESTPKMTYSVPLLDTIETPAARLRALLSRSPASSTPIPMSRLPSRSSDVDSDFEPLDASFGSTPSAARESLKGIFSRARRDPGNTPQKEKIIRRNSIDTSEVDASPRIQRRWLENKGKMKSLSDEEVDPTKTSETSSRSSQATTFDNLRERLINSHSQLQDLRFPDSIYHDSVPSDNEDKFFLRDTNISTTTPPVATSTPQQSLRMFIDSHLPSQSNLLDRDSEMHRAFEGFSDNDTEGASQRPVSFPPSVASTHKTQKPPSSQLAQKTSGSLLSPQTSHTHSLRASAPGTEGQDTTPRPGASQFSLGRDHKVNDLDQLHHHERDWGQHRIPAEPDQSPHRQFPRSGSPLVGTSSLRNLLRPGSSMPLRSSEEESSKGSSLGSQVDYQAELEREHNLERERDGNTPRPSRPTSSLGFKPLPTAQRSRSRSLIHVDSPATARTPQPHHSPTDSSRASSPTGSLNSHYDDGEIVHERERNWNAPRPKWTHGSPRPISPFRPQSPDTRMRGQSLKTLATKKGESPAQHNHTKDQITNDSAPSARATSPLPTPRLRPSSYTSSQDLTQSQKLQSNGADRSRSPSPPTSLTTVKGKGKALDQSLSESLADSSRTDHASFSTTKSGPSSGFPFVKKRTPLEPIELETESEGISASQEMDLPSSPTGLSAKGPSKPSGISSRSPKKSKVPAKASASIRANSQASNIILEPSQSEHEDFPLMADAHDNNSKPLLDVSTTVGRDQDETSDTENPSQKRMPTTPLTLVEAPPRSSRSEQSVSSSQPNLESKYTVPPFGPTTQESRMLHEFSPPSSPPRLRVSRVKPVSPLLTPPRRPSVSKIEFQTPSPPKNMPDLPGPPTSSEDEAEKDPTRPSPGDSLSNLTAMKTPRPPGAWTATPAFQRLPSRPSLSESSVERGEPSSRLQRTDRTNITAKKPLRPLGSWASTPLPFTSRELTPEDSVDTEEKHENGLSTPAASFSKGSLLYVQTPAPPGAYMVTPAGKKSAMKVRFDVNSNGSTDSTTRDALENITNAPSSNATLPQLDVTPRARTLELSTPTASRRAQSQKSPGIRVVDAFGRELIKDIAEKAVNNMKNKNGIRVVDALGREIEDNDQPSQLSAEKENGPQASPLKHDEALQRVRQGLADLVNDLNEMDNLEQKEQELDYTRLEKLQKTSTDARAARARVSAAISSNADDIKNKLKPLRAGMKESKMFMSSFGSCRWHASWTFYFFLVVQLFLVIAMYRISTTRAQELFLTTYYDPFYPDLHLYITKPDTLQLSIHDFSRPSWLTLPNTFYFEGWKASTLQIWHNLLIMVWNWQQLLWDKVVEGSPRITSWPPT